MICIRNKVKVNPAPFNQSFCFTSESSTLVSLLNLCKTGFSSQKTKFFHMKNYIWAKCSHTCQIFLWRWSTSILFFCSLCLGKIGSTYIARMVQSSRVTRGCTSSRSMSHPQVCQNTSPHITHQNADTESSLPQSGERQQEKMPYAFHAE